MQELIARFLFEHGTYVLPHTGKLLISKTAAQSVFSEKKITPPVPVILFIEEETDAAAEEIFIAENKLISTDEAKYLLESYAAGLHALGQGDHEQIPGVGKFLSDAAGKLYFEAEALPDYFFPDVHAERVIHPDSSHAILVGDTETNSAGIAEYYIDDVPVKKNKRWLWALLLFVATAAVIVVYLYDKNGNSLFGTAHKTEAQPAGPTYKKLP